MPYDSPASYIEYTCTYIFTHRRASTTVSQVDLCGHATLGAAHALWATGRAKRRRIDFETRNSGTLSCERTAPRRRWFGCFSRGFWGGEGEV